MDSNPPLRLPSTPRSNSRDVQSVVAGVNTPRLFSKVFCASFNRGRVNRPFDLKIRPYERGEKRIKYLTTPKTTASRWLSLKFSAPPCNGCAVKFLLLLPCLGTKFETRRTERKVWEEETGRKFRTEKY